MVGVTVHVWCQGEIRRGRWRELGPLTGCVYRRVLGVLLRGRWLGVEGGVRGARWLWGARWLCVLHLRGHSLSILRLGGHGLGILRLGGSSLSILHLGGCILRLGGSSLGILHLGGSSLGVMHLGGSGLGILRMLRGHVLLICHRSGINLLLHIIRVAILGPLRVLFPLRLLRWHWQGHMLHGGRGRDAIGGGTGERGVWGTPWRRNGGRNVDGIL